MKKRNLQSPYKSVAIVAAFLVALNFLTLQKPLYLDLTEDKLYTASDVSRSILGGLKAPVTVTFYMSRDLPADYVNYRTEVQDLTAQYVELSKGKLIVKYEDPASDEEGAQALEAKGIQQLQSQVVAQDKIEVKRFFFGATVSSGSGTDQKLETMAVLPQMDNFEYGLVGAVYSVSKEKKEEIAFLTGHGEKTIDAAELKKSYVVDEVTISSAPGKEGFVIAQAPAADGTSAQASAAEPVSPVTLVVAGPTAKLSDAELGVLDAFVKQGGRVLVLAERVNPDFAQGFVTKEIDTNIGDFTKKYGIGINDDLAYDRSNLPITYNRQTAFGTIAMTNEYPFWVQVVKGGFGDHPALGRIQSLDLLWASSLQLGAADGYEVTSLFSSTSQASSASGTIDLAPGASLDFKGAGVRTLGAVSRAKQGAGELVVIGDSDFVSPVFMPAIADNETFFTNLVDSLSSEVNLSSIRSKSINARPLDSIGEGEKGQWKAFALVGGTLILGVYGILRIQRRRRLSRS